jgi:hypothetical protein
MVHGLASSIELDELGKLESTQKSRVTLGYRPEQLLHFYCAL